MCIRDSDDATALVAKLCGVKSPPHGVLLDTKSSAALGGTGEAFDWGIAADAQRSIPLFLAGGLGPENVAAAVAQVRPFGVDISSGVEASKGVKDPVRPDTGRAPSLARLDTRNTAGESPELHQGGQGGGCGGEPPDQAKSENSLTL